MTKKIKDAVDTNIVDQAKETINVATEATSTETYKGRPFKGERERRRYSDSSTGEQTKGYTKNAGYDDKHRGSEAYPEHVRNIAFLMKNNSEIRRFTAIGIINYLLQRGEIKGTKRYVSFLWNKFQVKVDGLTKEYYYTEPFFLNCLVASFTSFAASATQTINTFTRKEMSIGVEKACDQNEIDEIVESVIGAANEDVEDNE